ncbi:MAG: hypothetical protein AAGC63_09110, partial [Propionicimonas sp.]|nr:hypothetical protein [Propionicimonas sp.]
MGEGGLVAVGDDRPGLLTLLRNPVSWAGILLAALVVGLAVHSFRWRRRNRGDLGEDLPQAPDGAPLPPATAPARRPGSSIPTAAPAKRDGSREPAAAPPRREGSRSPWAPPE